MDFSLPGAILRCKFQPGSISTFFFLVVMKSSVWLVYLRHRITEKSLHYMAITVEKHESNLLVQMERDHVHGLHPTLCALCKPFWPQQVNQHENLYCRVGFCLWIRRTQMSHCTKWVLGVNAFAEKFSQPFPHDRLSFAQYYVSFSVKIVRTIDGQLAQQIPRPQTSCLDFSPRGTYLSTWQPYRGNVIFYISV